ncbi:hypothetical protein CHUAL_005058 [Chamberlinius hualienensis]
MALNCITPWGEPSAEYLQFLKTLKKLPAFPSLGNPEETVHYQAPDGSVYGASLLRGIYEAASMVAKPNDIYVMSFPKTGTTWAQELVYVIGSNCDFETANSVKLDERFPFLEWPDKGFSHLNDEAGKRFIKTHLSYSNLPKSVLQVQPKIVYITRNPKDTCVSMYHFYNSLVEVQYTGTFEQFADMFIGDQVIYAPYGRHILEMWERRHQPNILFITYEQLQKDYKQSIKEIATFLGKQLTEDQVDKVADHCGFNNMSSNKLLNYSQWITDGYYLQDRKFMRKGQTGDWKNYFNEETNSKMDKWIQNTFAGSGLEFQYEL